MQGVVYSLCSLHTSAKPVKERQDLVSCVHSFLQPQGLSAVLQLEMWMCIHLWRLSQKQAQRSPVGMPCQPGEICPSGSPCCGVEGIQAVISTALQQGCPRTQQGWQGVSQRSAVAQPVGGRGHVLREPLPIPTAARTGSRNPSSQQSRASLTLCVRLLGWSPMRRVIPKLFLITFSTGGE